MAFQFCSFSDYMEIEHEGQKRGLVEFFCSEPKYTIWMSLTLTGVIYQIRRIEEVKRNYKSLEKFIELRDKRGASEIDHQ